MKTVQQLTVLGAGVLGAQIAFQAAFHAAKQGLKVVSYDISPEALEQATKRFDALEPAYRRDLNASDEDIKRTRQAIRQTYDLRDAVEQADFIIEAVPENLELKKQVWQQVGQFAPKHTVFTTNTSTLLPSLFAHDSGDTKRFLAFHFGNHIWTRNVVEVMGTSETDPAYIQSALAFGKLMGMVPVHVKKEHAAYIMNSLLVPLQLAARGLLLDGIAEPKDIDKVWRLATGAPQGPFEIMDMIGLRTLYAASSAKKDNPQSQAFAELIKTQYLDKGLTGKESGQGFLRYDEQGRLIEE